MIAKGGGINSAMKYVITARQTCSFQIKLSVFFCNTKQKRTFIIIIETFEKFLAKKFLFFLKVDKSQSIQIAQKIKFFNTAMFSIIPNSDSEYFYGFYIYLLLHICQIRILEMCIMNISTLFIKSTLYNLRAQIQSNLLENSNCGREFYTSKTFVGSSPTRGTFFFINLILNGLFSQNLNHVQ